MIYHLILSLKPIYSTPFPLITYICGRLYMEVFGKVKSYQDIINEMLSKQDKLLMVLSRLVKKVIGKWCYIKEGKRKIHTLEIGGHVPMAKSDLEAQRKSSLSDCTWLENGLGSFNLEALKLLMHFRELGSSFYFIFTYSHFFFSYIFFLFFLYTFFLFLSHQNFFICSPLNSKIALYLPPPPC
jgi:hypothetical protein